MYVRTDSWANFTGTQAWPEKPNRVVAPSPGTAERYFSITLTFFALMPSSISDPTTRKVASPEPL
jgi:hypothetical protein